MKTVKAKLKGTDVTFEGSICDGYFYVSCDHNDFYRLNLDEIEICKDSLQVHKTCKKNTDSFTSDLEKAARLYAIPHYMKDVDVNYLEEYPYDKIAEAAFIAGAEWQANQLLKGSPLPEDTVLFQKGVEEGKRLMMEEAVEGEIGYWNQRGLSIRLDKSLERLGYDMDTKVRIVIVKQDDRPRD